ncbi:MAG: DUF3106 domain-containing protein [Rhodocyclaceae bacterium]|nr:DUF3106 domain-containing protein [Rhodocyclaceae bacterium]
MGLQRHARRPVVLLLAVALIAVLVAIGYPRMRSNQDTPSGVRVAVAPQPNWKDLTAAQKSILAPLEEDWNNMERFRRKKWLEIAARYPNLTDAEQARIRERMQEWANLTPAQRQAARERYKALTKRTNAEEREALAQKWADYQNLPESVRQQLEQDAREQEKAEKRAARTPAVDGKPTPVHTKEGTLPTGTAAATLVTAPGAVKVVPPKAATPASPLTFAPAKPAEEPAAAAENPVNDNR